MSRPDARSMGPSSAVPYRDGEDPQDRHARRRSVAESTLAMAYSQCASIGARLTVRDGHWMIAREGRRAEWWPSSAKLVIDQKWNRGIHAHDWGQVFAAICKAWRIRR